MSILNELDFEETLSTTQKLYDEFLTKYGKLSKFQIKTFFSSALCTSCDSLCLGLLNILSIIITDKLNCTLTEKGYVNFLTIMGFVFSCLFIGKLSKRFTRRQIILTCIANLICFTFLASLSQNIFSFGICYILCGMSIGPMHSLQVTTISEMFNKDYRWFATNNIWIFYSLGDLYINLVYLIFIGSLEVQYWDIYFRIIIITYILIGTFVYFNFYDSPRYLILKGMKEEAFNILLEINNSQVLEEYTKVLSKEDGQIFLENNKIKLYMEILDNPNNSQKSIKSLFSNSFYLKCFLYINIILSTLFIVYYGFRSIFQLILQSINQEQEVTIKNDSSYILVQSIYNSLINIPSVPITGILGNTKSFSRFKLSSISIIISIIFLIISYFDYKHISIYSGIMICSITISLNIAYAVIAEVFPTSLRDIAIGFSNFISRSISAFGMIIVMILFHYGLFTLITFLVIFLLLSLYFSITFPIDTKNYELDTI